nr:protein mms22 [Quercus suber]
MKRWQDRGEVLDSDDEIVSLDSDLSDLPRKRVKLTKNVGENAVKTKDGAPDEVAFTQAALVATAYTEEICSLDEGRAIRGATLTGQDQRDVSHAPDAEDAVAETAFEVDETPTGAERASSTSDRWNNRPGVDPDHLSTSAVAYISSEVDKSGSEVSIGSSSETSSDRFTNKSTDIVTDGISPASPRQLAAHSSIRPNDAVGADTILTSPPSGEMTTRDLSKQPDEPYVELSTPVYTVNQLPLLSVLVPTYTTRADAPDEDVLSSGLSSPMSDGDVSPPPEFRKAIPSLRSARALPISTHDQNEAEQASAALAAALEADAVQPTGRRRALRVRKEQQLHPYLYEKAQYTKQWRSRGLQPVHYRVIDDRSAETQDSFGETQSQSQEQFRPFSSSATQLDTANNNDATSRRSSERVVQNGFSEGEVGQDELPDIRLILEAAQHDGQSRRKRQKLVRPTRASSSSKQRLLVSNVDEFAVPISPPATSSDSAVVSHAVPRFRLPYGMSPTVQPLPTPQMSSVLPPRQRENLSVSDLESPPRRRLRVTTAKHSSSSAAVEISSSSESESEVDQTPVSPQDSLRLNRVKKRIKGVLPASWLKIDLQAQKTRAPLSPSHGQQQSPPLSVSYYPTKGVAQRITHKRSNPAPQTNPLIISDFEDSDDSTLSTPLPIHKQTRLQQDTEVRRLEFVRDDTVNEEHMEADWIDPMFAGITRAPGKRVESRKRQPRIDGVFRKSRSQRSPILREHRDLPSSKRSRRRIGIKNKAGEDDRANAVGRSVPLLSIEDAPNPSSTPVGRTPQFVRLALRQARGQPARGRHSPSRKVIRLATEQDTNDATAVLHAWRRGALVRASLVVERSSSNSASKQTDDTGNEVVDDPQRSLQDITAHRQRPNTSRLQRADSGHKVGSDVASHGSQDQHALPQRRLLEPLIAAEKRGQVPQPVQSTKKPTRQNPKVPSAQFRTAQLETIELEWNRDHHQAAFQRRINCLTEAVQRTKGHASNERDLPLQRFLHGEAAVLAPRPAQTDARITHDETPLQSNPAIQRSALSRRPRKRQAKHVDSDARHYRQPGEPLPEFSADHYKSWHTDSVQDRPVLKGLGPFGTRYAVNFDIHPLTLGTYFRQSTFVGSGEFAAALNINKRDLSTAAGPHLRVQLGKEFSDWSAWTEDVANDISRIPGLFFGYLNTRSESGNGASTQHSNIDTILRTVIRYYAQYLHFLDPVDRQMCIQHTMRFAEEMIDLLGTLTLDESLFDDVRIRIWQYTLVVAKMAVVLCEDVTIDTKSRLNCRSTMVKVARGLVRHMFPSGFEGLRISYEDNRLRAKREAGLTDDDVAISTLVILHHMLVDDDSQEPMFWDAFGNAYGDFSLVDSVRILDNIWQNIFTVLPIVEIDVYGILHVNSRFNNAVAGWTLVKRLLDQTFGHFPSTDIIGGVGANDYIRAVVSRCHQLLAHWGWWSCEPMLITIFDFFARRKFAQLHDEPSLGSPTFLRERGSSTALGARTEESAFHIFLEMLDIGLKGMRQHYTEKKIGGIAFRLIPAHGREYRKEAEVRQRDLDALSNHMALLCTLYCSLPANIRPPISLLQGLVDHSTSHREACRLSVKLWSDITTFQISTDESLDRLRPLASWFQEILQMTFAQYRLARSEAEHDFELAKSTGTVEVTGDIMNATISRNQRQIGLTLVDALAGLERALRCTKSKTAATFIVQESGYWRIFETVDLTERRLLPVFDEALRLTRTCLDVNWQCSLKTQDQVVAEDSQEYGDLSALHELVAGEQVSSDITADIPNIVYGPVGRLVSNIFGADTSLDDAALVSLIDVWIRTADASVRSNSTSWPSYLDDYSPHSWLQLRHTEQKRKFTPYFLACVVSKIGDDFYELRERIMGAWLSSLLEREAVLKYQHLLTMALLNNHPDDELLHNLPFTQNPASGKFDVTIDDIRQRRLALISCILSNMRRDLDCTSHERPRAVPDLRHAYADVLHQAMRVMKDRYLELKTPPQSAVADSAVQGAYVFFVQNVISLHQQYATDICKIDTFFTESSAFPLPVTDRTYVVGRLRSYAPKLSESGTRKLLAVFVHTVGERAAADNEQQYLASQLCTAVDGTFDASKNTEPTLREVLLTAIFPVYIANALAGECTWLLAIPILQASSTIMRSSPYTTNLRHRDNMDTALAAAEAIVHALDQPLEHAVLHPGLLDRVHVQKIIALAFEIGVSTVTLCDYCQRLSLAKLTLTKRLNKMQRYAVELSIIMTSEDEYELLQLHVPPFVEHMNAWPGTSKFVEDQLRVAFRPVKDGGHWSRNNSRYFLQKDRQPTREIMVDSITDDQERARLLRSIRAFRETHDRILARSSCQGTSLRGSMTDLVV